MTGSCLEQIHTDEQIFQTATRWYSNEHRASGTQAHPWNEFLFVRESDAGISKSTRAVPHADTKLKSTNSHAQQLGRPGI